MTRDILGEIVDLPEDDVWPKLEEISSEYGVSDVPVNMTELLALLDSAPGVHPDEMMIFDQFAEEQKRCMIARYGQSYYRVSIPLSDVDSADWWDGLQRLSALQAKKEMAQALRRVRYNSTASQTQIS